MGEDALARLFLARSAFSYRLAQTVLFAGVLAALGAVLYIGCVHLRTHPHAAVIDGGWRVFLGQRPHTDFYSPLGVLPLLISALGMFVAGPSGRAIWLGYGILFPAVTFAAWHWSKRRLPAWSSLLYSALVGLLVIAPRRLDQAFHETTYAMQYNRLGWSLFCLLLLLVFLAPLRSLSPRQRRIEALSVGAILGLLVFTKVTYLGAGVAALLVGTFLERDNRYRWKDIVSGFLLIVAAFLTYLRFDLASWLRDLQMLGGIQDPYNRVRSIVYQFWGDRDWIVLLVLVVSVLTVAFERRGVPIRPEWLRRLGAAVAVVCLGLLICSTNTQTSHAPTFGLAALLLMESFRRMFQGTIVGADAPFRLRFVIAGLISTYLAAAIPVADGASLGYSLAWKVMRSHAMPSSARIDSDRMADMIFQPRGREPRDEETVKQAILNLSPHHAEFTPYQYANWVNDGLSLLRLHVSPQSRVLTFDHLNPFPFALGNPSPKGEALMWHYGLIVNENHHPSAERVFRDVDFVMVPKQSMAPPSTRFMLETYGTVLDERYRTMAESTLWRLYGRR